MQPHAQEPLPVKQPGPDHPIDVAPQRGHVVVAVAGKVIADTRHALRLQEARYPPVQYIPREDARMDLLAPSAHETYCPYKGKCRYFNIPLAGERGINAVWSYESPYPAVHQIAGHLAFYPDRV
ncbi:MAG: DUF427 domain-containing protein, partial [Bradyrhizobium sp.]